jgi:hypothetical protein
MLYVASKETIELPVKYEYPLRLLQEEKIMPKKHFPAAHCVVAVLLVFT